MIKFRIRKKIPGIHATTKGGELVGKTFETPDRVWIKELRKNPSAEEVVPKADAPKAED